MRQQISIKREIATKLFLLKTDLEKYLVKEGNGSDKITYTDVIELLMVIYETVKDKLKGEVKLSSGKVFKF